MEYAEAMSETPPRVTDELSARLLEQLGAPAMVELTAWVGVRQHDHEVQHGAGDRGPGVLQGVHAAAGATVGRVRDVGMSEDETVRAPPQPAVHRRLRDARLRLRRRGRRPGDVAAVGRRRPRGGARPAGLPGPHRHPSGAEPVADPGPTAGGLRRRVAAGAAADEPRRRRRRRAGRERLDRDAHRARDPRSGGAGRVRAPRGVRDPLRRDRGGGRQVARRRPPDRPPGTRPRRRPAAADAGQHDRAAGGRGPVPRRHPQRRPAGPPRRPRARRRARRRRRRPGRRRSSSDRGCGTGGRLPDRRRPLGGLRDEGRLAQRVARRPDRHRR